MSPLSRLKGEFPLWGMSPDTGQSLRTVLCLANPSGLQAARWTARSAKGAFTLPPSRLKGEFPLGGMSPDTGQSLRTVLCLANPSGLQAARWMARSAKGAA